MAPFPLASIRPAFRATAQTFVPALAQADEETWGAVEGVLTDALASRPPVLVRQLRRFLTVLDTAARLRHGRSLAKLDLDRRLRLLQAFERAPVLLVRRGVWGLRTLVFMGYYTQPAVITRLGYRASPVGWSGRR